MTVVARAEIDADLDPVLHRQEQRYGYRPNRSMILAWNPGVLRRLDAVEEGALWSGSLTQQQRLVAAFVAAATSGSTYPVAQMGLALHQGGMSSSDIVDLLRHPERTAAVDEATREVIDFARRMASVPNLVGPASFSRLRRHFDERQIVEVAVVVGVMGVFHRQTSVLRPRVDPAAARWAGSVLGELGWFPGPHARPGAPDATGVSLLPAPAPERADGRSERLRPLRVEDVPELHATFRRSAGTYIPNSFLIMARRPDLVDALIALVDEIKRTRSIPADLAYMACWVSSYAAGCQYCQAHTSLHARNAGVDPEKIERLWEFEANPAFDDVERRALRVAFASACQPSAVTAADLVSLRSAFDDREVVDLAIGVSNFGFYNRWNDTFATPLEDDPWQFATHHLGDSGWTGDRHRTVDRPIRHV